MMRGGVYHDSDATLLYFFDIKKSFTFCNKLALFFDAFVMYSMHYLSNDSTYLSLMGEILFCSKELFLEMRFKMHVF
ncbi:hypothetical protein IX83_05560 [Basilea psittacipulmonis DSM 24701]|uniref:Uncharacterized protein n=1 Tax=Basilea psittacipulmonis DSM 24701 TaxID=1072685 RepID=A0A077DDZ3_9BURK|nr:hypothetical protein IX83_05560 [Basilea psittacipulmonis DSM 24701]